MVLLRVNILNFRSGKRAVEEGDFLHQARVRPVGCPVALTGIAMADPKVTLGAVDIAA